MNTWVQTPYAWIQSFDDDVKLKDEMIKSQEQII